jgi:hypothetical protein
MGLELSDTSADIIINEAGVKDKQTFVFGMRSAYLQHTDGLAAQSHLFPKLLI